MVKGQRCNFEKKKKNTDGSTTGNVAAISWFCISVAVSHLNSPIRRQIFQADVTHTVEILCFYFSWRWHRFLTHLFQDCKTFRQIAVYIALDSVKLSCKVKNEVIITKEPRPELKAISHPGHGRITSPPLNLDVDWQSVCLPKHMQMTRSLYVQHWLNMQCFSYLSKCCMMTITGTVKAFGHLVNCGLKQDFYSSEKLRNMLCHYTMTRFLNWEVAPCPIFIRTSMLWRRCCDMGLGWVMIISVLMQLGSLCPADSGCL